MECPFFPCTGKDFYTLWTKHKQNHIRRMRQCKECGKRFPTIERFDLLKQDRDADYIEGIEKEILRFRDQMNRFKRRLFRKLGKVNK